MQSTPFGNFRVYLPGQQSSSPPESHGLKQEARFTFTCGIGQSVHDIQAHFRRDWSSLSSPKLYTQLSVFTLAESEGEYDRLFACASVGEIDDALRRDVISPYHINREGRNLCLYYAAEYARVDIFDYLDSQGIGISSLNRDISLLAGFFVRSIADEDRRALEMSFDRVLSKVYDSSSFLFETTMNMLLWDYYKGRPRSLLGQQMQRLQKEGLLPHAVELNDSPWDWASVSTLIAPLFQHDALREEGTEWLLHDSWQRTWAGKYEALR